MAKQLLHLVFGGELTNLAKNEFRDLSKVHLVGIYPNFAKAREAWRAAAQATVDNALMRYYVVHLHRLLDPDFDGEVVAATAPPRKTGVARSSRGTRTTKKGAKASNRK